MFEYLADLKQYGVGYNSGTDSLEFVDRADTNALEHHTVSLWSPCGMLQPQRAFYGEHVVGVRFECCALFLKHMELTPFVINNGSELLALYDSQSELWVGRMFEDKPHELKSRKKQAQNFYQVARLFFERNPESNNLPIPVRDKLVANWRKKPQVQTHCNDPGVLM